ncbi:hypothetical protein [Corynebacterium sp. 335C]
MNDAPRGGGVPGNGENRGGAPDDAPTRTLYWSFDEVDAPRTPAGAGSAGSPGFPVDAGPADVGPADVGPADVGPADAGPADAGPADAGPADAGPATPATPAAASRGSRAPLLVALAIVALAIGGVVAFLAAGGDDGEAVAASPSPTIAATATATRTTTVAPEPGSGSGDGDGGGSVTADAAGLSPDKRCDDGGATAVFAGTARTSCPFAANVGEAIAEAGSRAAATPGAAATVTANSPVTGQTYELACDVVADADGDGVWRCAGGNDAVVYVYP